MNPLLLFKAFRDLNALVDQANALAGPDRRWSNAFMNRSFIALVIATVAQVALAFGFPLPFPVDLAAETVYAIITLVALLWAFIERKFGKTRAVWNRIQGREALTEADALTTALNKVPGVVAQPPR
ncbi:hypothetical protein TW83_00330 [Paracoccus sp. S4493]|uniref:hypothetical protein n=1 Tax=Paracoccus sp. S4493 TaxID=579490 RepID=UPI0005FA6FF7|nr:hypothetical protein [Paracoccus sp. S4493]KJZ33020.1 hypothetical protein TW83_00330 [Paracoccus sp. S4493]